MNRYLFLAISFLLFTSPALAEPGASVYMSDPALDRVRVIAHFGMANSKYNTGTVAARNDYITIQTNSNGTIISIWALQDAVEVNGVVTRPRRFFSCYVRNTHPTLWETAQTLMDSMQDGTTIEVESKLESSDCSFIQLNKSSTSLAGS